MGVRISLLSTVRLATGCRANSELACSKKVSMETTKKNWIVHCHEIKARLNITLHRLLQRYFFQEHDS